MKKIKVDGKAGEDRSHTAYTIEQLQILYQEPKKPEHAENQLAARIQYEIAGRVQDVAALRYGDIDPND